VLITLEYTALQSTDYRQQIIQSLKPTLSADRPFSLRQEFADQWYDLHNPDQSSTPMTVRFTTVREDFPPNVDALKIQQVLMYFVTDAVATQEVPVGHLHYRAAEEPGTVGGSATSVDGIISTRRGNAGSWSAMIGKSPIGEWELALPNTAPGAGLAMRSAAR
jgi:predicted deacylase